MKRYYKDVFFEVGAIDEIKKYLHSIKCISTTDHFFEMWSRRGNVSIPTPYILERGEVFEYYRDKYGKIQKFCVRCTNISDVYDVTYVVTWDGCIVTAWSNRKEGYHRDVSKSLYCRC